MPRKKKNDGAVDATLAEIASELLDQFVAGPMTAASVGAVMRKFKKARRDKPAGSAKHRNGGSGTTVLTDDGPFPSRQHETVRLLANDPFFRCS